MNIVADQDLLPLAAGLPAILRQSISQNEAARAAGVFKALAEPARVRLLSRIAAAGDGGVCVCDLVEPLGLSQPTVSHHLKTLHKAGLVSRDRRGTWIYYSLQPDTIALISRAFNIT